MLSNFTDKVVSHSSPRVLGSLIKSTPRRAVDWKKEMSFRRIVRYVYKNSVFYKKRFDEFKIDPRKVKRPSDLGNFYTTPIDIIEHAEEMCCRKPEIVFESSGTTGRNKRVYFIQEELDRIGRLNAAGFFLWGMTRNDRLVNAFDFCIWIPGLITQKGIEYSGLFSMAAGKVDPSEVYKRIPQYKFNVILGEPTWLIKLTELAEKNGAYPMKLLIGSAEGMPEAARPWIQKVWPGVKVKMVYASVESAGTIAAEISDKCEGYHIDENDFYVEIADPDADGYGEVVFTTLNRVTMPIIRYRNRDVSRIIEKKCPCGIPMRQLAKIRGRADELVVASGGNLYPLMFEEIFKDVKGITSDWQIVFKHRGIKEVMEINLELMDRAEAAVKKDVFDNMKSRYPDLWKNYSIAIFETDFNFHSPGKLRAGKHKLLRMVDMRYGK